MTNIIYNPNYYAMVQYNVEILSVFIQWFNVAIYSVYV